MHAKLPSHVIFRGQRFNQTGSRSRQGTFLYVSPAAGESIDVCLARVAQTGAHFFLAETETGGPLVRVDHHVFHDRSPVGLGQIVVLGPIDTYPQGPRAAAAWRAHVLPPVRRRGIIAEVAYGAVTGRILAEGGAYVFVHRGQLQSGVSLVRGKSVSFVQADVGFGPTAYDVRPA
jgi:hypothetical protein